MKAKNIISIAVCVIILLAVICPSAQDKVDLKLRLKAGDSHEIKMTQTQDVSQAIDGREMKMKQTQEMVMGMDCLSVESAGVMDVQITYKSMKIAVESPTESIEVDSANPQPADPNRLDQKMMAAMVSALAGCKFQINI